MNSLNIPTLPRHVGEPRQPGIYPGRTWKGVLSFLQLHLAKLLSPKFAPSDLASDGFGQLGNKLHLAEEKANHPELVLLSFPTNPHSSPLPLNVPQTGWHHAVALMGPSKYVRSSS